MLKNQIILFMLIGIFMLITAGCNQQIEWQGDNPQVITLDELKTELRVKMERVQKFLSEEKLGGILLTSVRNFSWITGGIGNNCIVITNDIGAASLLIMADGKKYLICNGSESARLMHEDLIELGYELKQFNWYENNSVIDVRPEIIASLAQDKKIGSDTSCPGTIMVENKFAKLRYQLTEPEIKKYRWLGRQCTEAVVKICRTIKPGMNENEIEAATAVELRMRGITPTVLLIGVDDRIFNYRHCLAAGKTLEKYAMINICARKWGLVISVTRFVYFGELPEELATKLNAAAEINAKYLAHTIPGTKAADIMEACKTWYAEANYEGEWQKHHQGGAAGYNEREWVNFPGCPEVVLENQAFAWNPTITGAKVEDTIIALKGGVEVLTVANNWPMIPVTINEKTYSQPGILIR